MTKGLVISWLLLCGGLFGVLMYMGTRDTVVHRRRFND